jgi:copper chaperone
MKQALKFKTNINCSNCVEKVKPFLDSAKGIDSWEVDTTDRNKILTIEGDDIYESAVIEGIQKAGFSIEKAGLSFGKDPE